MKFSTLSYWLNQKIFLLTEMRLRRHANEIHERLPWSDGAEHLWWNGSRPWGPRQGALWLSPLLMVTKAGPSLSSNPPTGHWQTETLQTLPGPTTLPMLQMLCASWEGNHQSLINEISLMAEQSEILSKKKKKKPKIATATCPRRFSIIQVTIYH